MNRRGGSARILLEFVSDPEPCPYLPDRTSVHENRVVASISPDDFEAMLDQGWRKFGPVLYRPACPDCDACRPLRIPAEDFEPSRSQRRCLERNLDAEVVFGPASADDAHVDLYNRYHAAQQFRRGWPSSWRDSDEYRRNFLLNPVPSGEISVWVEERLVGVALVDITGSVVSGVYHYHDPEMVRRGLGTLLMLHVIGLARQNGRRWAHFGYHVAGCRSLEYKTNFQPCELLGPDHVWRPWKEPR